MLPSLPAVLGPDSSIGATSPTGLELQTHRRGLLPPRAPQRHRRACRPTPGPVPLHLLTCIHNSLSILCLSSTFCSCACGRGEEQQRRQGTEALPPALQPARGAQPSAGHPMGRVTSSRQLVPLGLLCLSARQLTCHSASSTFTRCRFKILPLASWARISLLLANWVCISLPLANWVCISLPLAQLLTRPLPTAEWGRQVPRTQTAPAPPRGLCEVSTSL